MEYRDLTDQRRQEIVEELWCFFSKEYDEDISNFRAEQILTFVISIVGDMIYEQAIEDAHDFMAERTEELYTLQRRRSLGK